MRTVALISGGKDSCFNMMHCVAAGHQIVCLANLRPLDQDETDSYMYQSVGHDAIDLYADAAGLPLYREYVRGRGLALGSEYEAEADDEVEDLYRLLARVVAAEDVEAVSVGAILSDYQRVRVEDVCRRLRLTVLAYLWRRPQAKLLDEMISCGVDAVLIKVAALGLRPDHHLGRSLRQLRPQLDRLNKEFGLNVCGEGGEYETLTLDCPLFVKKILIEESKTVMHSKDPFAPVAYLVFPKLRLVDKEPCDIYKSVPTPEDFCFMELDTERGPPIDVSEVGDARTELVTTGPVSTPRVVKGHDGGVFVGDVVCRTVDEFDERMLFIQGTLQEYGLDLTSVVWVGLYLGDMADYSALNAAYVRWFAAPNPPARACVQVSTGHAVLLELIAAPAKAPRRGLHVQSVSHWAPANIGPYSQCQSAGRVLFLAGQIGLVPGRMRLPEPTNFGAECRLALRHAARVLDAVRPGATLDTDALQIVCYLRHGRYRLEAEKVWAAAAPSVRNHVVYVVVDGLPRDALVEWQVCAVDCMPCTDSTDEDGEEDTEVQNAEEVEESVDWLRKVNGAVSMVVGLTEAALSDADASDRWVRRFDGAAYIGRLFHRADVETDVVRHLLDALQRRRDVPVAVTAVPVAALARPEWAAVLCCLQVA